MMQICRHLGITLIDKDVKKEENEKDDVKLEHQEKKLERSRNL